MSTGRPNELPEGSGGGAEGRKAFRPRPRPGLHEIPTFERRPHPAEIPVFQPGPQLQHVLMQEVLQLRDRVHSLESHLLVGRFGGGAAAFYNPAEYPEGGEGGGGEIVEIADIGDIAEYPIGVNIGAEIAALHEQFASFEQRIASFEQRITTQIGELKQQIGKQH